MYYGDGRIIVFLALGFYLFSIAVSLFWYWRQRRARRALPAEQLPGVTILKPLQGIDEELEKNLESFACLDYPRLQLIFACQSPSDPALEVARRVAARHPRRDILILAGTEGTACSPKVLNLEAMLPHARHELAMISDSNVRIEPGDLATMAAPFADPRVGLVYQPVVGIADRSVPAALENLRLTEYGGVLTMGLKQLLGLDAVMGKGMLMRRAALADVGDFHSVRDVAADDYVLGTTLSKGGWKLCLSTVPARVVHTRWSLPALLKRHTRHAAMRVRLGPWTYPIELLVNPIALSLVTLGLSAGQTWWVVALAVAVKTTSELAAGACLRGRWPRLVHVPLVAVKDVLMAGVWFAALFSRRVHWRGKDYRMGPLTRLDLVDSAAARQRNRRAVRKGKGRAQEFEHVSPQG